MPPLTAVMHLVLGANNTTYETCPMTLKDVVDAVRDGQFSDVYRVLSLTYVHGVGKTADVTRDVARAIYAEARDHPIAHGSEAYFFVERELSCASAEECAWEDARERGAERRRELISTIATW